VQTYLPTNSPDLLLKMVTFNLLFALGLVTGAVAQQCPGSWYLESDDCICINSRDGQLLKSQTLGCCRQLGYRTYDNVCFSVSRRSLPKHDSLR
jgi:hypothetical protein